jgi:photosystem II stability/assembly factor-like uncharacterized protein
MRFAFVLLSFLFSVLIFLNCEQTNYSHIIPSPTEKTAVHKNGEDGESYEARMNWIELMHGGRESGWRSIESENQMRKYESWLKSADEKRSDDEYVAGGQILGKWTERGSNNNAGNIMVTDYDAEEDVIYAVGGGGPLFKGDFSGFGWSVVNDKLRFSTNLLKVFHLNDNVKRILSAVNGIPHYSEDDGKTWKKSSGVTATSDGWEIAHSQFTSDGKIFFLGRKDYYGSIKVYVSFDFGTTFKTLKLFNTSDGRNIALSLNAVKDEVYVIEQISVSLSNFYKFNPATKSLDSRTTNIPIGFGENGRANLQSVTIRDTTNHFVYTEDKKLYVSKDEGKSWKFLSNMPSTPWEVGLYVCPSNPDKMIFGEVNGFRTVNGGVSWIKINDWSDYYDDIENMLHADIMTIKEFRDKLGTPFILNGNHGGLYFTEDYGKTHSNIGLYNLNVSQYYDVRSYPSDHRRVFAGSQDQGQQRGIIDGEETAELFQNISGDYGHIEFTGNGKSLWSVYPGGSIGFYSAPLSQRYPVAGYEIESNNETVWIPPIIPGTDPEKDIVLAAGGSVTTTSSGSHIIHLEYKNNGIVPTQLPFNFAVSGGQISAMAIHPNNKSHWFVATTNGKFYKSTDSGQSFTKTAEFLSQAHYLYGSCILPSAQNPNVIYLSGNGYANKPVYRSVDGGLTFSEFSNGLPKTMVFNIVANEDESLIFAATENGPYVCIAATGNWFELSGIETPNQTFWSVEYIPEIKTARFGTYGRGIWDFEVKEIISGINDISKFENTFTLFPNPASDFITIKTDDIFRFNFVTIYDSAGRIVLKSSAILNTTMNISQLPKGLYFVEVSSSISGSRQKLIVR